MEKRKKIKPQALILELKINSEKDLEYLPKEIKCRLLKSFSLIDWDRWKSFKKVLI